MNRVLTRVPQFSKQPTSCLWRKKETFSLAVFARVGENIESGGKGERKKKKINRIGADQID